MNASVLAKPSVPGKPVPPRDARLTASSNFASWATALAATAALVLPVILYFGFFAAILVDERVLETSYLGRNIPHDVKEVLEVAYTPLFVVCDWCGIDI